MEEFESKNKKPRRASATDSNYYCPHCKKPVSKSTWYLHHSQYFHKCSKTWDTESSSTTTTERDFVFESDSSASVSSIDLENAPDHSDALTNDKDDYNFNTDTVSVLY